MINIPDLDAFATSPRDEFIAACEAFTVQFHYVNQSNGTLLTPDGYGLPTPMLQITEVGGGPASVPAPRPVPWSGLAAGANEAKTEMYDGINPNNTSHSTTVTVQIAPLPATVSGITAIGKDIGFFENMCP